MQWYENTSVKSVTREYKSQDAVNKDAAAAAGFGWTLASVNQIDQRSGCVRIVLLMFLALIWKPKPRYLAVFTHA